MRPHLYNGLGDVGQSPATLRKWLGANGTVSDRVELKELFAKYPFASLRDGIERVWMRQARARRYYHLEREGREFAQKITKFRADNARQLEASPEKAASRENQAMDHALHAWARRLASPLASAPGERAVANRSWADRVLRDAGVAGKNAKDDRRLLLKLLARAT